MRLRPAGDDAGDIERLQPDRDLAAVIAIEAASFASPWTRDMVMAALDPGRRPHAYVVRFDVALVAYCIGQLVVDELHIHTFAVHPDRRRDGLGRRLLAVVLRQAEALGVMSSTLEVRRSNTAARRLYESAGFTSTAVRRGYYRDPAEDALIYWRHPLDADPATIG